MSRAHRWADRRTTRGRGLWAIVVLACALLATQVVAFAPAEARPGAPDRPGQEQPAPEDPPVSVAQLPEPIDPVDPVDPGPNENVVVQREPNRATQQIDPLPALAPEPGRPDVPTAPVTPDPAVRPSPLELPTRPAQELIDATAADALATIDRAGYVQGGVPNLDANQLQPQVSRPQLVDGTRPATLQELIDALLSGNLPPDLGIDPLALLEQLPEGLPRITYRVCSESATKEVSCSLTLPLGVPAIVDVTGDRTPDVLADLLPAAAPGDLVGLAQEVLDTLGLLEEAQTTLAELLELMADPLWLLRNPWAILERLRLLDLVDSLTTQVQDLVEALLDVVHLGLAFLQVRLPTSEHAGEDLPGHVWAVYDVPGGNRLSLGYDGFRRGTSLSTATLGLFTFAPLDAVAGRYDIRGTLVNVGAGDALAVTAGLAEVADTDEGEAINPTVASARFSPVPTIFSAHADIRPAEGDEEQRAQVDATSNVESHLDTIVMSNSPETDRYVQADVEMLPTRVSADLRWTGGGDRAQLAYEASATIDDVLFADFTYTADDVALRQATQAHATQVPASFDADLTTTAENTVALDYTAASELATLDAAYYDAGGEIVLRGGLRQLPTELSLLADPAAGRVLFDGNTALGEATVAASLHLGGWAPLDGDHATLVTDDPALGVSARVTGMQTVDAFFDGHPRLRTVFDPGGQAFDAAGHLDGVHEAEAHISNLPAEASLDVDTATQELTYEASAVIDLAHVAYTNTVDGPSVLADVHDLPAQVHFTYELGDRPQITYDASSEVTQVDFFASLDHVENLRPTQDHYLSTRLNGIPTTMDFLVDLPARHMQGEMADTLDAIAAVARFPLEAEGRDWTAIANLGGIPAEFDADWAPGTVRMRGISGPLASVDLAAFNHPNPSAPLGLRLAAHYRESTGDIDAAVATLNLSHVEYAETETGQQFRLDTDIGGQPLFVDVDVVLSDPADVAVDDTRLAVLGRVDNLPATLDVTLDGDRLVYTADRSIGLALEVRLGKVAALDGLGAPLFPNGVGLVARTCGAGPGCAEVESPFCLEVGCLGLVGTINLPGLPTEVAVDMGDGTVNLVGYRPPAAPLQAFVRLVGLIPALPDLRAQATLSGLPSPVDFTVGPVEVSGSSVDVGYTASAPLGSLRLDADVRTTNAQFPVVRARATVDSLPQTLAVNGTFGPRTSVGIHNSAAIASLGLTVTSDTVGYIRGTVTDLPADVDVVVDVPARHIEGTASAPVGGIELLAQNIPFDGDTWGGYVNLGLVPAQWDVDWQTNGEFRFRGVSGPLGLAQAAVTNHPGAQAPVGSHLAAHLREATGAFDASASVSNLRLVEYTTDGLVQAFNLDMSSGTVTLDADVVLAAGGVDDTRLAAAARLATPSDLHVEIADGRFVYRTDPNVGLLAQARAGKVAALEGLGAPIFDNGIAVRARGCEPGSPGCSAELFGEELCQVFDACLGAVGTVNLPGLPDEVVVDMTAKTVTIADLQSPGATLQAFVDLDGLIDAVPRVLGLATLTGLPASLDLTVGPFHFGERPEDGGGQPPASQPGNECGDSGGGEGSNEQDTQSVFLVRYEASAPVGRFTAHMQADTRDCGSWRGLLDFDSVPQSALVFGSFGEDSVLLTSFSAPVASLSVRATGSDFVGGEQTTGSALARLTDVPATTLFGMTGFGDGDDLGVPTIGYAASDNTLDGLVEVEANLVEAFPFASGAISVAGNAYAGFDNLGRTTTVELADSGALVLDSGPTAADATDELFLGASVDSTVPLFTDDIPVPLPGEFTGNVHVEYGVENVDIGDIRLTATELDRIEIHPGGPWINVGVLGTYGQLSLSFDEVFVDPQVSAALEVGIPGDGTVTVFEAGLRQEILGVRFHRSDYEFRSLADLEIIAPTLPPAPVACLAFQVIPSERPDRPPTENEVTINGADGPQVVNYIDPILGAGPIPEWRPLASDVLQLLTVFFFDPFEGVAGAPQADWRVEFEVDITGCPIG